MTKSSDWLNDGGFPDEETQRLLLDLRSAARALTARREARGALDFDTVEARVLLDEAGEPIDVVVRQRTEATSMIEEAMILANEVVAEHMAAANAPMIYRIHESPEGDALKEIAPV